MSKITLPNPSTPTPFYKIVFPDFSEMKLGQPGPWLPTVGKQYISLWPQMERLQLIHWSQ